MVGTGDQLMADIFVSYASEDRDRTSSLVERLEEEGWSTWWDREIHAGPRFDQVIEEEINSASCVVVVWSEASVKSDWVRDEANEGRERNILVPLVLDDVRPPMGFRSVQTANLIDWPEQGGEIDTLLSGVRALLGGSSETTQVKPAASQNSIVVLPFDNISPDPNDAYFSDGLTEEITTKLSHIHSLRVISRRSAMVLKSKQKDVLTIGRELDVQYVLEGSVRKAGNNLRITAQLIDAGTDSHRWSETYDGVLEDVFGMQEDVAHSIVAALELTLNPTEEKSLAARPIEDPHVYQTYLLAMHESNKFTQEGTDRAIRLTQQALATIGENALLSATLADCYYVAYDMGFRHSQATLEEIEKWASKAMELDPVSGQAHWAMGLAHFKQGDLPSYVRYGRKAMELDPDSRWWWHLAFILAAMGNIDEARYLAQSAVERDPLWFNSYLAQGALEIFAGHPALALQILEDASRRVSAREPFLLWWEAQAAGYAGDEERAERGFEELATMGQGALSDLGDLFSRALLADAEGVRQVLERPDLRDMGNTDEYFPIYFANAFARVGELDEAIQWVEKAVSWGFINHEFLSRHNAYLAPLREDPRFQAQIARAREKELALDS
jgi:TolB-like protein